MTFRLAIVLVALPLVFTVAFAAVIRDGSLSAESTTSGVVLRWVSDNEGNVSAYQIERSISGNADQYIVVVPRLSARGSGQTYQYVDETAFKIEDSYYRYRVTPVDSYGSLVANAQALTVVLQPRTSAVHRTWGSIKAMFR